METSDTSMIESADALAATIPGPPPPNAAHMFPRLSSAHIARLASIGRERRLADGEGLWDEGATDVPLFVVLEGGLVIRAGCDEHTIVVHEPGGFTGDVDMLSGRRLAVSSSARGATRLLEIERSALRGLMKRDAELGEIFLRAFILRRAALISSGLQSAVIVGSQRAPGTLRLQEFLMRNGRPYTYLELESDPSVHGLLDHFHLGEDDLPVMICWGSEVLRKPGIEEVAERLNLGDLDTQRVHDVVVVGAGPAGLSAAVYAASEGLDVLVLEGYAPGGQAGSSSRIENYLGFPMGISGNELAARAFVQAEKFGATIAVGRVAARIDCDDHPYEIEVASERIVKTRTVVIATGAQYRNLGCTEIQRFVGMGVYHAATALEAKLCEGEEIAVVGGGNSAGQAAMFFARTAKRVHVLVRGPSLSDNMSEYLVRRIAETPNIEVRTKTQIEHVSGDLRLESVTWVESSTGRRTTRDLRHVFLMTGATPNTSWLEGCVVLDEKGFVKTGADLSAAELQAEAWPLARRPYLFETSLPGVFAVGDVRAASTKRVAAAVGEGSVCVQLVHEVLAERASTAAPR